MEICKQQSEIKMRQLPAIDRFIDETNTFRRQRYDKRTRILLVKPGQEVFRHNFVLSDFSKSFNAKFTRKFL